MSYENPILLAVSKHWSTYYVPFIIVRVAHDPSRDAPLHERAESASLAFFSSLYFANSSTSSSPTIETGQCNPPTRARSSVVHHGDSGRFLKRLQAVADLQSAAKAVRKA